MGARHSRRSQPTRRGAVLKVSRLRLHRPRVRRGCVAGAHRNFFSMVRCALCRVVPLLGPALALLRAQRRTRRPCATAPKEVARRGWPGGDMRPWGGGRRSGGRAPDAYSKPAGAAPAEPASGDAPAQARPTEGVGGGTLRRAIGHGVVEPGGGRAAAIQGRRRGGLEKWPPEGAHPARGQNMTPGVGFRSSKT